MGTFVFIFLVVGAVVGLVMGIAKTKRDSKHKKESQFVFNNLKDFKADNYYLSTSSGMSIGFDNQRKKFVLWTECTNHLFMIIVKSFNVRL